MSTDCLTCGRPMRHVPDDQLYCPTCDQLVPVAAHEARINDGPAAVMPDRFTLSIELGNELMTTPLHVAGALSLVADRLADGASVSGSIRDINGNLVGQWRFQ